MIDSLYTTHSKWRESFPYRIPSLRQSFSVVCLSSNWFARRGSLKAELESQFNYWWQGIRERNILKFLIVLDDSEVPSSLGKVPWARSFKLKRESAGTILKEIMTTLDLQKIDKKISKNPDLVAEETEAFLDKAERLVIDKLEHRLGELIKESEDEIRTLTRLAEKLGIHPASNISLEGQQAVKQVAWCPIAHECIISLLRSLLKQANSQGFIISEKQLDEEWASNNSSLKEFARRIGLNVQDASIALFVTKEVFFNGNLFTVPVDLIMDENMYQLSMNNEQFVIHLYSK